MKTKLVIVFGLLFVIIATIIMIWSTAVNGGIVYSNVSSSLYVSAYAMFIIFSGIWVFGLVLIIWFLIVFFRKKK